MSAPPAGAAATGCPPGAPAPASPVRPAPVELPEVQVIVVAYRCRELLRDCLRSVRAATRTPGHPAVEVTVVDNDSCDGTVEMLRGEHPWVRLIEMGANLGFAAAVNAAAAASSSPYLLLLNPDATVEAATIPALVGFARNHPWAGIYGGRTLRPDGTPDPRSCWGAPSLWSHLCFAAGLTALAPRSALFDPESLGGWERDSVREVPVVTGCLMLVRRDLWRALAGFDEAFFMYGEDADLCLRAARLGWRPVVTPQARAVHLVGGSSGSAADKAVLLFAGKVTLCRRRWTGWRRRAAVALLASGVGARAAAARLGARHDAASSWAYLWSRRSDWLTGYQLGAAPWAAAEARPPDQGRRGHEGEGHR